MGEPGKTEPPQSKPRRITYKARRRSVLNEVGEGHKTPGTGAGTLRKAVDVAG